MPEIYIPTCAEIEALKEGGSAPDCFGNWRQITRIYANRSNTVIFTADGKGVCHQWGHLGGITHANLYGTLAHDL